MTSRQATPTVEFWYEFGSSYSYLSTLCIESLAQERGVQVVWQPFLLGPIFKALGWDNSPFVLNPLKGQYMWRDIERRAARYGLPFKRPTTFPRASTLPMHVAAYAAHHGHGWLPVFSKRVMHQNFVEDLDISQPAHVLRALDDLVASPQAVLEDALSNTHKPLLRQQTMRAKALGIFGAPTFMVGPEMFWGDDRLDDAMAFANALSVGSL